LYFKVLFMNEQESSLQELHHIRRMMEQSTRFISLSGFSGIAAGVCALAGSWFAVQFMHAYASDQSIRYDELEIRLWLLAAVVLVAALALAFVFTYLRSKKNGVSIWGNATYRLLFNLALPLAAGGFFIVKIAELNLVSLIAPACLLFYGLALLNASKYTLGEIKYLGICEIILGVISLWVPGYGLVFWAAGFGVLHILYGGIMWWKYERK